MDRGENIEGKKQRQRVQKKHNKQKVEKTNMRKTMIKGRKEIYGVKDEKVAKKGEQLAGKEKA